MPAAYPNDMRIGRQTVSLLTGEADGWGYGGCDRGSKRITNKRLVVSDRMYSMRLIEGVIVRFIAYTLDKFYGGRSTACSYLNFNPKRRINVQVRKQCIWGAIFSYYDFIFYTQ